MRETLARLAVVLCLWYGIVDLFGITRAGLWTLCLIALFLLAEGLGALVLSTYLKLDARRASKSGKEKSSLITLRL